MSLENSGTCGGGSSSGDVNNNIRELLLEIRSQRSEINSLKEEVRGASQSVASEVKNIRTVNDIRWRFEGNRLQFEFNSELEDSLKQTLWALENEKRAYALELLNGYCEKLKTRNKHIKIADFSEGGWETVRQYINNPLASDSDDESRLNRAESRAVSRKRVNRMSPRRRLQLLMVILTLLISVCGMVWLQRQAPFSHGFSQNHLGLGLVLFLDTQTQQINAVSSASDPALPAANQITSDATVHTPRVQFSNNLTYLARKEPGPLGDSPEFDIEDEYLESVVNNFDHDRFTEDYFEYEQGQKDIIFKYRLRKHIAFWRDRCKSIYFRHHFIWI